MHVVVVESPAEAKTVGRYLGSDYRVFASSGHVSDLPAKDGSVRPEDGFLDDHLGLGCCATIAQTIGFAIGPERICGLCTAIAGCPETPFRCFSKSLANTDKLASPPAPGACRLGTARAPEGLLDSGVGTHGGNVSCEFLLAVSNSLRPYSPKPSRAEAMTAPRVRRGASSRSDSPASAAPAGARPAGTSHPRHPPSGTDRRRDCRGRHRFPRAMAARLAAGLLSLAVLMGAAPALAAPGVESITVTTAGPVYKIGDYIQFKALFSERLGCVKPAESDHELKFEMGVGDDAVRREAGFHQHSPLAGGKSAFYFRYTVEEGDSDPNGIYIPRGDSALRGQGYYKNKSPLGNCENRFTRQRAEASFLPNHKIDGVRPVLESAEGLHDKVTLTFSEDLDVDSVPGPGAFAVGNFFINFPVTEVGISGSTATLSLGRPLTPDDTGLFVIYGAAAASEKLQDVAGNDANSWNAILDNETQAATIKSVALDSSPGPDDTFAIGDTIRVKLTLSEAVEVDTTNGTPRLKLRVNSPNSGATQSNPYADYVSGSGTDKLIFAWTVEEGCADTNGFWIKSGELERNGGTVRVQGTDADLRSTGFYPSDIYVDGIRPALVSAETSPRGTQVELTFNEDIRFATGTVSVDGRDERVASDSITGNLVRLFVTKVIEPGETVTVRAAADDVEDRAGNGNVAIEDHGVENKTVPPAVSSVTLTSIDAGEDDTYAIGDTVEATVTFGEAMTVSGSPTLELDIGGTAAVAEYDSGESSGADVVFVYTIEAGDEDSDGISIGANRISLNSGTIRNGEGQNANLVHAAVPAQSGTRWTGGCRRW